MMDRLVKVHGWTRKQRRSRLEIAQQESGVRSNGPMGDPSVPERQLGYGTVEPSNVYRL